MPKYTYYCDVCKTETILARKAANRDDEAKCVCGEETPMKRQFSKTMEATVLETVDGYRNVKHRKDQDTRIRTRAKEYFVEKEMPELIAKHGVEYAKRVGWVKPDGTVLKKDDLK